MTTEARLAGIGRRVAVLAALTLTVAACQTLPEARPNWTMCAAPKERGCFTGTLTLVANPADPSGETRKLGQDFGFVDGRGKGWQTNQGDVTNGASIPKVLQPIVGDAYSPGFIAAAVVHDRYCDDANKRRVKPWPDTHRMFYEGLLASGVDRRKARLMYYAVYTFGPRWTTLDPATACRGTTTPMCEQFEASESMAKAGPDQAMSEGSGLQDYTFIDKPGGQLEVLRRSLINEEGVADEIAAVSEKLDALPLSAEDGGAKLDAEIRAINALSDKRFPKELILADGKRGR
jgi:hypothetical protein